MSKQLTAFINLQVVAFPPVFRRCPRLIRFEAQNSAIGLNDYNCGRGVIVKDNFPVDCIEAQNLEFRA